MAPKVEIYRDWTEITRAAGDELSRGTRKSLFDRLDWFRLLAEHAPPAGQLLALRADCGEEGAWLFLAVENRCARAFANWYTLRFSATGADEGTLVALARELRRIRPALDRLELYPLAQDDPLPAAFLKAGWITRTTSASTRWHIDTKGMNFDAYWATRGSQLRNTARRKTKAAGLDIQIHRAFDGDAWRDYERVYQASWKPLEGSAAFLRALAEQEGAAGTLRLGIARKDGRPIAAQFWLVENGIATIHKLAYVQEARNLSPGTILSVEMFRHVLDVDKVHEIDFGTGDDGYKADWMERSEPLNRMVAYNPASVHGLTGAARSWASDLVRRVRSQ
jgi:CelD/BcsL family acetyltransferase involved in cellulose biosynthesis